MLRPVGTLGILLENPIPELNLIGEFTINAEEGKQNDSDAEKAADIGERLIYLLEAPLY